MSRPAVAPAHDSGPVDWDHLEPRSRPCFRA